MGDGDRAPAARASAEGAGLSRRRLLQGAAAAGLALPLAGPVAAARAGRARVPRRPPPTVAVLGGGVGGLSAAHELAGRGFRVVVLERRALGGKARSFGVAATGTAGRRDLPAEHGMRFFPGFYTNLPDTLSRIPFGTNPRGVLDNLVAADQLALARAGGRDDLVLPLTGEARRWRPEQLRGTLIAGLQTATRLPPHEVAHFADRLLVYLSSSEERRFGQWEHMSWRRFTAADRFSDDYDRLLVSGISRHILAARADVASARTLGSFYEAMLHNVLGRHGTGAFDRLLDAPTNEAWIDPWVEHLRRLGVRFRRAAVERLVVRDGRVVGARVRDPRGRRRVVRADWFVCAVPAERAPALWDQEVLAASPALARVRRLRTEWMNAIQFFLREPRPLVHGHVLHLDSPWALSSVSQAQFWPERDFARDFGDGTVRDCLSVDIGDFGAPGILFGRPARECCADEIAREVWAQLRAHVDDTGAGRLDDGLVVRWHLDPALVFGRRRAAGCRPRSTEPLLLHTPGSWEDRPAAATGVRNLVLAADYVRTDVDLACMEGANEAARHAVNAILDRSGSGAERCRVWRLLRPPEWEEARRADRRRWERGERHALDAG